MAFISTIGPVPMAERLMVQKELDAKVVRMVKKKTPWAAHLIEDAKTALDLNLTNVETRTPSGSLCPACKGVRMLCRKTRCPITTKLYSYLKMQQAFDRADIDGSSPPGVFIGRFGYPDVFVGPMVPPVHGDTNLYDFPEGWFGKTIEEIVDFRFRLVRGMHRANAKEPEAADRMLEETRFLAMTEDSVDVELNLKGRPRTTFVLNDEIQPMGPSAPMANMKVGNARLDSKIEKAFYDVDLKAVDATVELFGKGVPVSKLQKALSVGAFGLKERRRLVPTRWSITAVDSMLGLNLIDKVKDFPLLNEFRVYESTYLDNRFEVILLPESWRYEAIEAWYPGTIWNPSKEDIFLFGDWESYWGRTTYAKMGGCYYAARLAVNELLLKERRQAGAIVLREAHPDYIMPVGVWQVRENVRNALRSTPLKFNSFKEVLERLNQKFDIPLGTWVKNSEYLTGALKQTKMTQFF